MYAGLAEAFGTISGIKSIILGEPTAIHECPAIYTMYSGFTRPLRNTPPARNLEGTEHTFVCSLVIAWTDYAAAEAQLLDLVTSIPDVIDLDPQLGGRVTKGMASCRAGSVSRRTVSTTTYLIADYTITVLEKRDAT